MIDGSEADVVTLALAYDVDAIARRPSCLPRMAEALPQNSRPTPRPSCSWSARAIPKIKDWDVVKAGVAVVTPNPKTSGGARWNYLAAWGYA